MKAKVGNTLYDAENEPIMVILTEKDRENIQNMIPGATRYCQFPTGSSLEEISKFMKTK